jgi:hypothetical protein
MTDLLIPDVPDDLLSRLDAQAEELGLTREELLYLTLKLAVDTPPRVTVEDLKRTADTYRDLGDPEVMRKAWQ